MAQSHITNQELNILFTCIGRRNSLVRSFRRAGKRLGYDVKIVGADTDENSPALQISDRQYLVRRVAEKGYAREIMTIIEKEKIDLLVPTVDLDLPVWARRRSALKKHACTALISSPRVISICQDKRQMYSFLEQHGFDTPRTWSVSEILRRRKHHFPYFLKPWDGHASKGNQIVHDKQALHFFARRIPNCIVQEFIPGQEYTVDALVDFQGRVRCVVPRRRLEVRTGEVSKGMTVKNPLIIQRTRELVETLKTGPGVITIQCFLVDDHAIKFIEINPRFGGGVPLSIKAGADFPRWILQMMRGEDPDIRLDGWRNNLIMMRYDEAVWRFG